MDYITDNYAERLYIDELISRDKKLSSDVIKNIYLIQNEIKKNNNIANSLLACMIALGTVEAVIPQTVGNFVMIAPCLVGAFVALSYKKFYSNSKINNLKLKTANKIKLNKNCIINQLNYYKMQYLLNWVEEKYPEIYKNSIKDIKKDKFSVKKLLNIKNKEEIIEK